MDSYWHCDTCGEIEPVERSVDEPHGDVSVFYSCPECGSEDLEEREDCTYCETTGKVIDEETGEPVECDECRGKGYWEKGV